MLRKYTFYSLFSKSKCEPCVFRWVRNVVRYRTKNHSTGSVGSITFYNQTIRCMYSLVFKPNYLVRDVLGSGSLYFKSKGYSFCRGGSCLVHLNRHSCLFATCIVRGKPSSMPNIITFPQQNLLDYLLTKRFPFHYSSKGNQALGCKPKARRQNENTKPLYHLINEDYHSMKK